VRRRGQEGEKVRQNAEVGIKEDGRCLKAECGLRPIGAYALEGRGKDGSAANSPIFKSLMYILILA
jgi:hypothetical protein